MSELPAGLKIGKEHVRAKTYRAVVFDPDDRNRILYRAEGIGWTKHWRAKCQRWIDDHRAGVTP